MELKLYKDTLQSSEIVCSQKYEQPVEIEVLIPEYLPAVFKIVKTIATPVVLQKQVSGGRYAIDGYIRVTMLYQPEGEEGICAIEQKMPFQKQFEMKQGPYSNHFGEVSGEIGYLNCRAVNGRRVDIRGAYYFSLRVFGQIAGEVATAAVGQGICQKSEAVTATALLAQGDKQFTVEGELLFAFTPESILYTHCIANVNEVRIVGGKAVAKGEIKAEVTYRTAASSELQKAKTTIPFNQIVDIDGLSDGCRPVASADVPGCTLAADGDNGTVTATCILSLRMYKETEHYILKDVFSTRNETEVHRKNIYTDTLQDSFQTAVEVKMGGNLPDEHIEIIECLVTPFAPELIEEDGRLAVRGKVAAHLICRNALGEMECYDKVTEYILPKRYRGTLEDTSLMAAVHLVEKTAEKNGAEADVNITLGIDGEIIGRTMRQVVEGIEELGAYEEENGRAALVIYYAQKGEEIFYIAKHYHANPEDIAKLANLSGDLIEEDCQLLIPAAE